MVTLISLATLGLGIAIPLQANAQSNLCTVQDRRLPHQRQWRNFGNYRNRQTCDQTANRLRHQGYEVRIVNRR